MAAGACLAIATARAGAQTAGAQVVFQRGLTALHNFEYEEANESFQQAQEIAPRFVMAYWGEAMTYNQTLWRHEDIAAARRTLARLGRTAAARARKARSDKEKDFLGAVEMLFGNGDAAARHRSYADRMARMYERYPDDPEVASFYALALLGTMSRGLIGHMEAREDYNQALAGSDTQKTVTTILELVLKSHPNHPGALHYLLHNNDDPDHASIALPAARTYAQIAPESSHALHMPAHIFFQLGLWHDAAVSDQTAFAASNTWIRRKGLGETLRNYHALAWLQYELLQLGRYREAWDTIGEIEPVVKASGQLTLQSDLSSMRARYAIETRRWDLLARERNFGNAEELFAIGISAARSKNPQLAEMARRGLAERAQAEQEGDLRPAIAVMEREVAALIELAAGRREAAAGILQDAARAELQLPAPFGLPAPLKPAPELLGEVLIEVGRPREAIESFDAALRRNPNRSLSILGKARASTVLGDTDAARRLYAALLANYDRADVDLAELTEARAAIEHTDAPRSTGRGNVVALLFVGVGVLTAGALLFLRIKRRQAERIANSRRRPQRTRR